MTAAVFIDTESLVGGLGKAKFTAVNVDAVVAAVCDACNVPRESLVHYAAYGPWWRNHDGLASVAKTVRTKPGQLVNTKILNGKSLLDSHLIIDATAYEAAERNTDTYVIISSDADMVPLADRFRANGRRVIGVGRTGDTKERTADAYHRYIWFSREELSELAKPSAELVGQTSQLRQWVLDILGPLREVPASNAAARLRDRVSEVTDDHPDDYFEAVVGIRQFKQVIAELFPDGAVCISENGGALQRPDPDELPSFRGGSAALDAVDDQELVELPSFRGHVTTALDPADDLDGDEEMEWDDERWSILTLPVL